MTTRKQTAALLLALALCLSFAGCGGTDKTEAVPIHIDYATALVPGEASVLTAEGERFAACSGGMLSVNDNHVRLMATTFEWEDEIDLARAQRAQEAAEEQLRNMNADDKDYALVEAKLKRALARIRTKG